MSDWYDSADPCAFCGVAVGCDPDADVNAQDFKGGGNVLLLNREPKIVAHGNCEFWASDADKDRVKRAIQQTGDKT